MKKCNYLKGYLKVRVLDLDIEPGPNGSNRSCNYDNLIIKFESLRRSITLCGSVFNLIFLIKKKIFVF